MSTKSTLLIGENWHLYTDCGYANFDEVPRLSLEGDLARFEAESYGVTVTLPPAVLDAIAAAHRDQEFPHQHPDYMERADLK